MIATDGWVLEDTTALTAGMKYIYEVVNAVFFLAISFNDISRPTY